MRYLVGISSIFLLALFFQIAHAQVGTHAALTLDKESHHIPLGPYLEIFEDPTGQLDFAAISSSEYASSFQPTDEPIPNYGFSSSVFWVKLTLKSTLAEKSDWFLEVDYPPLDSIGLFDPRDTEVVTRFSGDKFPFKQRDIQYHNVTFSIELKPFEEKQIFLKVNSSGSIQIPLTLWHPKSFTEKVNSENYLYGIYCGIMLVVIFYNLFLFLSVRDYSYLHYVLYVLSFTCIQLVIFGFAYEHLWPENPWLANHSLVISLSATMLFISLFSSSFLHMRTYSPRSHHMFMTVAVISAFLVVFSIFGSYRITILLTAGLALILTPMPLITGYICLKRGYDPARFYLFAWLFLLFGCLAFILKSFGLAPNNMVTTYGAQIGSAIEVILLSLALGDRINYERKEKYYAKSQAVRNLEKSDQLKDEFMATISHELRTPLNGVSCSLALIEAASKNGLDISEGVAEAERSTYAMQSLIDDLLCFTEAKNEEVVVSQEHFKLSEALQPMLNYYQAKSVEKSIAFEADLSGLGFDSFVGDKKKLIKILTHLIDNAVKFTQQGKVSLKAKAVKHATNEFKQQAFMFSVCDTGKGIPEEKRNAVYEAFSQVDSSFTRDYGGLGIGLAICLTFVRAMGGSISLTSKPGKTCFDVVLFFDVEQLDEPETREVNKQLTVLIVEDNPVNQALVSKLVRNMGHQVVKAENGQVGLEKFQEQSFDLILMDCQMPVMDGFQATKEVRKLNADIPIIAVTANALEKDRQHCFDVGMNDFVSKPIQKGELENAINRLAFPITH
ncbi:MAG: response regulator [Pseudomonadales bacterium]|nr:response regulator [Pseudomonadales bacterium]